MTRDEQAPEPNPDGVSPATAHALRAAMHRLLDGHAQHTDGQLTKNNLHREAGISRATMNRAAGILSSWDAAVAERSGHTPAQARRESEADQLRTRLAAKNRECAELHRRLNAAATVIAALHHDNTAIRDELTERTTSTVIPLRARATAPLP